MFCIFTFKTIRDCANRRYNRQTILLLAVINKKAVTTIDQCRLTADSGQWPRLSEHCSSSLTVMTDTSYLDQYI